MNKKLKLIQKEKNDVVEKDVVDQELNESENESMMSSDDEDVEEKSQFPVYKPPSSSLYRPPTNDEIMNLKQTSQLFSSNLFKLQISELLSQVQPAFIKEQSSARTALEKILFSLKADIESIPESTLSMTDLTSDVLSQIPFPSPKPNPENTLYKISYCKPSNIAIGGSFLLRSLVQSPSGVNIDMIVQMPKDIFQEKDYVNHRYFHKRAYYLYSIASGLKQKKSSYETRYDYLNNDLRRPILVLSNFSDVKGFDQSGKLSIRIIPALENSTFIPSRLGPLRGNIRKADQGSNGGVGIPSPMYNSSILSETGYLAHLNFLHAATSMAPSFTEAVSLGKVWIHQRGLDTYRGYGFNGFVLSMIMAWLLQHKAKDGAARISKSASSYQMFKVTMDFLAKYPFEKEPLFLTASGSPLEAQSEFTQDSFQNNFDVSIVDPMGIINLTFGMTLGAMKHVQVEAENALQLFQNTSQDCFGPLFLKKLNHLELSFDNLIRFNLPRQALAKKTPADYADETDYVLSAIPQLLREALGNRVRLVSALARPSTLASRSNAIDISIGILLDAENSLRMVELGPDPAIEPKAVERFQDIWGSKVELRRFQDGSIRHAVLFEGKDDSFEERSCIVSRMVSYLIQRHFISSSVESKQSKRTLVSWGTNQGNSYLVPGLATPVTSFQPVMEAFQSFSKQLKNLRDLPLSVSQVLAISSGLSFSSTMVPQPMPDEAKLSVGIHPFIEPLSVVIEFESSGKWPDDLSAIQVMKQAFYIRLATELEKHYPGTECSIFSASGKNLMDGGYLDVSHGESGYIFRCRIHHDREATLISRALSRAQKRKGSQDESELSHYQELTRLKEIDVSYRALFVEGPAHLSDLHNACLRHPHLGLSIRLAKRWLSSHLLLSGGSDYLSSSRLYLCSEGIPEQAVETLVKNSFVQPGARLAPNSSWVGFLRFLELLSTSDVETLVKEASDKKECDGAMTVIPEVNRKVWTRVKMLATSALTFVRNEVFSADDSRISTLFTTPTQGYHALLHLDTKFCSTFHQNLHQSTSSTKQSSKFKNVVSSLEKSLAVLTQINPVRDYLQELHEAFGHLCMFFVDSCGGDKIAIVWKSPESTGPLKTNLTMNVRLGTEVTQETCKVDKKNPKKTEGKQAVESYRLGMMAEMQRLGGGLVVGVQLL